MIAATIVAQLGHSQRQALAEAVGGLKKLGRLYDRLSLLFLVRTTQLFAVAFNIGAIASLVLAAYVTDPSFGWRSTLLTDPQVEKLAWAISLPWHPIRRAYPNDKEVAGTRYSTLEARFGPLPPDQAQAQARNKKPKEIWAAWWPFLVASLVVYGLLPRSIILAIATWRIRAILAAFPENHPGIATLRQRLTRHAVLTSAPDADPDPLPPGAAPTGIMTHSRLTSSIYHVLVWAGVDLDEAEIRRWLKERHRCEAASIRTVGNVDRKQDTLAIQSLAADANPAPVLVIVQAWEPPVGDYLDLLVDVRRALGNKRLIHVLLHQRGPNKRIRPPRPIEMRTWQGRVNTLGDGWITVEPMAEGAGT